MNDKRNERRARNNASMVEACRKMMAEGVFRPSADDVARAAQCSVRTVFHHFATTRALYRDALRDFDTRLALLHRVHPALTATDDHIQDKIVNAIVLGE